MSDVQTPAPAVEPQQAAAPAPAPAPAAAPGVADALAAQQAPMMADGTDGGPDTRDFRALWEREKNERIRERNLYRPAQRIMDGLEQDQIESLQGLAEMARAGDASGIVEWALATAQNLSGQDLAALAAARNAQYQQQQYAPQPGQYPGQQFPPQPGQFQQPGQFPQQQVPGQPPQFQRVPGGFGLAEPQAKDQAEVVREMVQAELRTAEMRQQIVSELQAAGYTPNDPLGQAVIRHAMMNGVTVTEAAKWLNSQLAARQQQAQGALAAAGAETPQPAPVGAPAANAPATLSPKESAMARLQSLRNGAQ